VSYRDNVDALSARHRALAEDVRQVEAQRDDARRLLDAAKAKLRLPILDNVTIASPCKEDWAQMTGDARVRHCLRCDQNVYNLSDMTREEAETLILEKEGKLCVRYFRRKQDGKILVKDCPVGAQRRKRRWIGFAMVATIAGTVLGIFGKKDAISAMVDREEAVPPDHEEWAGGMVPDPAYTQNVQPPAP
jgi:hypothetical protein